MRVVRNLLVGLALRIRVAVQPKKAVAEDAARSSTRRHSKPAPLPALPTRAVLLDVEAEVYREVLPDCLERLRARVVAIVQQAEASTPVRCPKCGRAMESLGKPRGRTLRTGCGELSFERRVFRCRKCRHQRCPGDEALGLPPHERWSPWAAVRLTALAAVLPFAQAARMAAFLFGIAVSNMGLWQLAGRVGQRRHEFAEATDAACADPARCPDVEAVVGEKIVQVGMDGAMIMMRAGEGGTPRHEGEDPLEEEGARCTGREVKTAVIYRPEDRFCKNRRRGLSQRRIVSVLGTADQLIARIWSTLVLGGLMGAQTTVAVIGDGAEWIWERAKMFVRRIEILDYWHAAEHAWKCARAVWGEKSAQTRQWAHRIARSIRAGKVRQVIHELDALLAKLRRAVDREAVQALHDYYEQHADRMNYPRYRRLGLSIGSGATESAHKQVNHVRMRQAGMRWSERGARRMIALRTSYLHGDFAELESLVSRAAA
jgi:hypothetical protein